MRTKYLVNSKIPVLDTIDNALHLDIIEIYFKIKRNLSQDVFESGMSRDEFELSKIGYNFLKSDSEGSTP